MERDPRLLHLVHEFFHVRELVHPTQQHVGLAGNSNNATHKENGDFSTCPSLIDHVTAMEHEPRNIVFRRFLPSIRRDIWLLRPRLRPRSRLSDEFVNLLYSDLETSTFSQPPDSLFV